MTTQYQERERERAPGARQRFVGPPLVAEGPGSRAGVRAEAQLAGLQVAQFRSGVVRPGTSGFAAWRFAGGLRCAGRG